MKKFIMGLSIIGISLCSSVSATPVGILYTGTNETVSIGSGKLEWTKSASGSNFSILGLVGLGDANADTLAKENGISEISHIDKATNTYFLFFNQETYTIYGK